MAACRRRAVRTPDFAQISSTFNPDKDALESGEQACWEEGDFYGEDPAPLEGDRLANWEASRAKVHPTSIRLPPALLVDLKKKAAENGLGLHAYIRMVLTRAVKQSA